MLLVFVYRIPCRSQLACQPSSHCRVLVVQSADVGPHWRFVCVLDVVWGISGPVQPVLHSSRCPHRNLFALNSLHPRSCRSYNAAHCQ